jgi:uncharacterized protein YihD (DUF1040 family)
MRRYYETLNKNASELFWKINQNQTFDSPLAELVFHIIVRDCQIFGNEIWTAIRGLQNDAEGKENDHTEHANCIKANLLLHKAGDDKCKKATHSWAQSRERHQEHIAVYVGQRIKQI